VDEIDAPVRYCKAGARSNPSFTARHGRAYTMLTGERNSWQGAHRRCRRPRRIRVEEEWEEVARDIFGTIVLE